MKKKIEVGKNPFEKIEFESLPLGFQKVKTLRDKENIVTFPLFIQIDFYSTSKFEIKNYYKSISGLSILKNKQMMEKEIPFKMYSCCLLVKGKTRSLICDVQRSNFEIIPNALFEILKMYNGRTLSDIFLSYKKNDQKIIFEYFTFLLKKEYIYFTSQPELFPNIKLNFHEVDKINNAIVEYSSIYSINIIQKIFNELSLLGDIHLELRFYHYISTDLLKEIITLADTLRIVTIVLILSNSSKYNSIFLTTLMKSHPRITDVIIFNSEVQDVILLSDEPKRNLIYTSNNIASSSYCGMVSPIYFANNIKHFTEAQRHNTCLNRKISIDVNGDIKNCPSMPESFGNIKDTTLAEAIEKPGFKKYWNINKDKIHVCKDCEFRYICTDCRAYVEDPKDIYSKPLKCGYNPYTGEWEEWSTNPLKQKAIDYYGMREMVEEGDK